MTAEDSDSFLIQRRCVQSFDTMPARAGGRYCGQCSEVVTDLSSMTYKQFVRWSQRVPEERSGCVHAMCDQEGRIVVRVEPEARKRLPVFSGAVVATLALAQPACTKSPPPRVTVSHEVVDGGVMAATLSPPLVSDSGAEHTTREMIDLARTEVNNLLDGGAPTMAHTEHLADGGALVRVLHPHPPEQHANLSELLISGRFTHMMGGPMAREPDPIANQAPQGAVQMAQPVFVGGDGTTPVYQVDGVLRGALAGVRACYSRTLRANPDLRGAIVTRFTIGPTGRVIGTPMTRGFEAAPEVPACVATRLRMLAFAAPTGGSVEVETRWLFASQ